MAEVHRSVIRIQHHDLNLSLDILNFVHFYWILCTWKCLSYYNHYMEEENTTQESSLDV